MDRSDMEMIFDAAAVMGAHRQRMAKIRDLTRQVRKVECGDCDKWMKSGECPHETHTNGRPRGPAMSGAICSVFVETGWVTELRAKRQAEIDDLTGPTPKTNGERDE